jgi:hypothetical protein
MLTREDLQKGKISRCNMQFSGIQRYGKKPSLLGVRKRPQDIVASLPFREKEGTLVLKHLIFCFHQSSLLLNFIQQNVLSCVNDSACPGTIFLKNGFSRTARMQSEVPGMANLACSTKRNWIGHHCASSSITCCRISSRCCLRSS